MDLKNLQQNWDRFGKTDPLWAILTTEEGKDNNWDESAFFETGTRAVKRLVKRANRLLPALKNQQALDFGCGVGRLTQPLADHFEQAHGIDIAPSMIELARQKNTKGDRCKYHLNERNDLRQFEDNSMDLVLSLITLQHMRPEYAKNYIKEFIRITRPGGIMIFQIPSNPDKGTELYHHPLTKFVRKAQTSVGLKSGTEPVMEMYWIPLEEMVTFFNQQPVIIRQISFDQSVGEGWKSYLYYIEVKK